MRNVFWTVTFSILAVLLILAWWFGRRHTVTGEQLERQRRQLGIHDGKGNSFGER
jgi:hypothetical protein